MSIKHLFNWHPDIPDFRDHKYALHKLKLTQIPVQFPSQVDLRPFCSPVFDQGQYGSCHDDQTEVLTDTGWKLFSQITFDNKLASVNPETKKLIFEYPSRIIEHGYNGPMYYGQHNTLDFAVTPDHTMVVRKWNEKKRTLDKQYSFIKMENVGWYSGLLNYVEYSGEKRVKEYTLKGVTHKHYPQRSNLNVPINVWLKFLGIYIAEGTVLKEEYKIQLAASKLREKSFIREVLTSLNISFLELPDRFTISNKRLYQSLVDLGLRGVKAPQKFVPEFIFHLSSEQIKNFLLGHFMGDGCEQGGRKFHYTSSKRLADDLQRLIFLSGGWSNIHSRAPRTSTMKDGRKVKGRYPEYNLSIWKTHELSIDKKENIKIEQYKGSVWCAEMPTYHTLVTRRNGKILIAGNCTSQSLAGHLEFLELKEIREKIQGPEEFDPSTFIPFSRLFIYWNERDIEGTTSSDSGAQIRDGIKSLAQWGDCKEGDWSYLPQNVFIKPTDTAYQVAASHKIATYMRLESLDDVKHCLSEGFPVSFGFTVFESFESPEVANTGIVPIPQSNEECEGGHAVLAVGYDDTKQCLVVRNSWGPTWGDRGYFYLPYEFVTNQDLSDDYWTIRK